MLLCAFLFVQFSASSYATSSDKTIGDILSDLRDQSEPSSLAPLVEQLPTEGDYGVSLFSISPEQIDEGAVHFFYDLYRYGSKYVGLTINSGADPFSNKTYITGVCDGKSGPLLRGELGFRMNDGTRIAFQGESAVIDLSNVLLYGFFNYTPYHPNFNKFSSFTYRLYDVSGNYEEFEFDTSTIPYDYATSSFDLSLKLDNAPFDIYKIVFVFEYTVYDLYGYPTSQSAFEQHIGFSNSVFSYTEIDATAGFFASIIEWLRDIRSGISGVVSAIVSIPGQIWGFIESGLKSLFVPDQQQIIDFNNAMDELLGDRLGALYQATSMVVNFLLDLGSYDQQGTIRFPGLDLSSFGIPFVMEPQDVQIVPESFNFVVDAIKLIVNILATLAVLNALKRRLERVFGGD